MNTPRKPRRIQNLVATILSLALASLSPLAFAEDDSGRLSANESTKAKASLDLINAKLAKVSESKSQIKIVDSEEIHINHSADGGKEIISISTALLRQFSDDRDAIASLVAGQHVQKRQLPEIKNNATTGKLMGMLGSVVNNAVDRKAGVSGVGQTLSEGGSEAIGHVYSQSQDRAADETIVKWMLAAGYNPHGAVRAQQKLLAMSTTGKSVAIDNQAPASADKVAYLEALVMDNAKARSMGIHDKNPLWAPAANSTIALSPAAPSDTTTATLGRDRDGAKVALTTTAIDDPIEGISLIQYAAIKNDIAFTGESSALSKRGLTSQSFQAVDQQWTARLSQDNLDLSKNYETYYLEASQGDFADWGRDVAQVKQTGRLQLATDPTAVDDWLFLQKLQKELASSGPDAADVFAKAAKEKGLSVYDFNIIHSWWMQRVKDQAAKGDNSLAQRLH